MGIILCWVINFYHDTRLFFRNFPSTSFLSDRICNPTTDTGFKIKLISIILSKTLRLTFRTQGMMESIIDICVVVKQAVAEPYLLLSKKMALNANSQTIFNEDKYVTRREVLVSLVIEFRHQKLPLTVTFNDRTWSLAKGFKLIAISFMGNSYGGDIILQSKTFIKRVLLKHPTGISVGSSGTVLYPNQGIKMMMGRDYARENKPRCARCGDINAHRSSISTRRFSQQMESPFRAPKIELRTRYLSITIVH